jgi:hypothetical protein
LEGRDKKSDVGTTHCNHLEARAFASPLLLVHLLPKADFLDAQRHLFIASVELNSQKSHFVMRN